MKLKLIALIGITVLCIGFVASPAQAEDSIIIDNQAIGEPPAASTSATKPLVPGQLAEPGAAFESQSEADRLQNLKNGRISPRQRAEILKSELTVSNKSEGEAFLMANKAKHDVISLPSGVQYKILRASKGKNPTASSQVLCRFRGTLLDGTVIDKSDIKKPILLQVSDLIPGLSEAVKLMPVGSKWQIFIPPQLAFGDVGKQGVEPNAVLIYEIELVSVK